MLNFLSNKSFLSIKFQNSPTKKIFLTLFVLCIYRFCNTIPLTEIDQEALKQSFLGLEKNNSILQILSMYSGGGGITLLSPFSLGIIPFINASILIDLLTAILPQLEKLQNEEGELGRRKIAFYKKVLTLIFSIVQSIFLIFYLKAYIYNANYTTFGIITCELTCGAMLLVWLSNIIDNKGIGNGTSILIFANIVSNILNKDILKFQNINNTFIIEIGLLLILMLLICISQTARITIDVVSARQLAFLENFGKNNFTEKIPKNFQIKDNGLSIRFNQAGIFPIIIASNLIPFISYFSQNVLQLEKGTNILTFIYYLLIIGFNYFYTIVFWDPEKISEQLRKASVSILNVTPGQETISYLENVVRSTSILGGIFLCFILFLFDFLKQYINGSFLVQINISSLIILVGVGFEIQRTIRSLYKNVLQNFT
uniref:Preprotein translocase subunit SecY n=1 Tax=Synura uvella TaxID=52557 RepID=A0A3G2QZL2_9STRA|nr:preprotein translocase subunit SecY [Synura uvella]AYO28415.1 preprotein translocase subunit SecY [Synura uvella]